MNLIQGCYNRTTNLFLTNPSFSPIFDANGLQFSEEQKERFRAYSRYDWYDFAKKREMLSFQEMYNIDKQNGLIDKTMKKYSEKYQLVSKNGQFDFSQYAYTLEQSSHKKK